MHDKSCFQVTGAQLTNMLTAAERERGGCVCEAAEQMQAW